MTVKTYARRDSATATLRKLGVGTAYYNDFIKVEEAPHGKFYNVDLDAVKVFVNGGAEPAKASVQPSKKPVKIITRSESIAKRDSKKVVAATTNGGLPNRAMGIDTNKPNGSAKEANKVTKRTVSSAIRALIKAGKTNAEIWAVVQPEFKLDDNKKHYPGWYRSELNRKGA